MVKQWIPLESNPEILTTLGRALGLPTDVTFSDVWTLDMLDLVPQPVHAVLLLYPLSGNLSSISPPTSTSTTTSTTTDVPFFCKQTISNACGTIALIHAALNAPSINLQPHSFLANFQAHNAQATPDDRAKALADSQDLDDTHAQFAQRGQSAVPDDLNSVKLHFVCFVQSASNQLYMLDGRLDKPVLIGSTSPVAFLNDTAHVIRSHFMAADPNEHRFTVIALTGGPASLHAD